MSASAKQILLLWVTVAFWQHHAGVLPTVNAYNLVADYSGSTFFDKWDFYGMYDNLTNGKLAQLSSRVSLSSYKFDWCAYEQET